ncbi:RNA-directed DNA polymerase, eukaryota, reverse transcriptase zinc-binding domain protein, partial [Tanacetum coccineum]
TPLQAWSHATFNRIASKWGELVYMDESNASNKYSMRLCVKTRVHHLIAKSFKVILEGKVSVVCVKEVIGWVLDFGEDDITQCKYDSDNNLVGIHKWEEENNDDEVIPNSFQSIVNEYNIMKNSPWQMESSPNHVENFDVHVENSHEQLEDSHDHVENYTEQIENSPNHVENSSVHVENSPVHLENSHDLCGDPFRNEVVENVDHEGISSLGIVKSVPKNMSPAGSKHDHVDSLAPSPKPINGFSILERFQEFISIGQAMGFVYSLQDMPSKIHLWAYMTGIINRWHGEVIVMGDFNEVYFASERHGSNFYALNAAEFNMFITKSHLIDVPLDSWNNDGVHASNVMILLKKKLKSLKLTLKMWSIQKKSIKEHDRKVLQDYLLEIDLCLEKGEYLPDDLPNRDENSKFFHGIVNKKKRQQAIKGILVDGEWIDNHDRVKREFYNHFANRFSAPNWSRVSMEGIFPRRFGADSSHDLEGDISNDDIKRRFGIVGLTNLRVLMDLHLSFFFKYWPLVGEDVSNAVKEFFNSSIFPNGCNPLFIALIPKVLDVKHLSDYRPISLIGCQYKIIGNFLANRLSLVIDELISHKQSAFIKGRQILDGPLILNEIVSWCKSRKVQALLFKVDFQKAFDSVRCDHLDDILEVYNKETLFLPFLSILVMESLYVAFQRVIDRGMFVPILVGKNDLVPISHLFYVVDVMFIGSLPTYYMPLFKAPDRVLSHLERLRNSFFLGAKMDERKINFLSSLSALWLSVIKAIHGSNGSLHQPPTTCTGCYIWITIHKATASLKSKGVYLLGFCKKVIGNGNNSNFWYDKWLGDVCFKVKFNRLFNLDLQKDVAQKFQNPDFAVSFRRRPRGGIEVSQFQELSLLLSSVVISSSSDRWSWMLNGHGDFSVKSAREEIDKHLLVTSSSSTRWSKLLPIKLNVFVWCMFLDKLPTSINLSNKGLDVPCVLCLNCGNAVESHQQPTKAFLGSLVLLHVVAYMEVQECGFVLFEEASKKIDF